MDILLWIRRIFKVKCEGQDNGVNRSERISFQKGRFMMPPCIVKLATKLETKGHLTFAERQTLYMFCAVCSLTKNFTDRAFF